MTITWSFFERKVLRKILRKGYKIYTKRKIDTRNNSIKYYSKILNGSKHHYSLYKNEYEKFSRNMSKESWLIQEKKLVDSEVTTLEKANIDKVSMLINFSRVSSTVCLFGFANLIQLFRTTIEKNSYSIVVDELGDICFYLFVAFLLSIIALLLPKHMYTHPRERIFRKSSVENSSSNFDYELRLISWNKAKLTASRSNLDITINTILLLMFFFLCLFVETIRLSYLVYETLFSL